MEKRKLLTVKQVAKELNCSGGHVRNLCKRNALEAIDISRVENRSYWRITQDSLNEYMQATGMKKAPVTINRHKGTMHEKWEYYRSLNK